MEENFDALWSRTPPGPFQANPHTIPYPCHPSSMPAHTQIHAIPIPPPSHTHTIPYPCNTFAIFQSYTPSKAYPERWYLNFLGRTLLLCPKPWFFWAVRFYYFSTESLPKPEFSGPRAFPMSETLLCLTMCCFPLVLLFGLELMKLT